MQFGRAMLNLFWKFSLEDPSKAGERISHDGEGL